MSRPVAIALAALLLAAAAVLLLLASDVRRWETRMAQDDLAFQHSPGRPGLWAPRELVPGGVARALLQVGDDVAFRRALRLFRLSRPRQPAEGRPELSAARDEAQAELSDLERAESDARRRSEATNLLGVLALNEHREGEQGRRTSLESGIANFQAAVRLDDANERAKFNLELALRRQDAENLEGTIVPRTAPGGAGLQESGSGY